MTNDEKNRINEHSENLTYIYNQKYNNTNLHDFAINLTNNIYQTLYSDNESYQKPIIRYLIHIMKDYAKPTEKLIYLAISYSDYYFLIKVHPIDNHTFIIIGEPELTNQINDWIENHFHNIENFATLDEIK